MLSWDLYRQTRSHLPTLATSIGANGRPPDTDRWRRASPTATRVSPATIDDDGSNLKRSATDLRGSEHSAAYPPCLQTSTRSRRPADGSLPPPTVKGGRRGFVETPSERPRERAGDGQLVAISPNEGTGNDDADKYSLSILPSRPMSSEMISRTSLQSI